MKTVIIPDGMLHLSESKANCPFCKRHIPIEEIEEKWEKQDKTYIKMKCKCKRFIGITQNFKGDFIAYKLERKKNTTWR